eukprot:3264715-Pyramimonas_sp.AAC.1
MASSSSWGRLSELDTAHAEEPSHVPVEGESGDAAGAGDPPTWAWQDWIPRFADDAARKRGSQCRQ